MGRAKEIKVKVIPSNIANAFIKKHHYSGKYAATSKIHFGCFLDNRLHGVLSYGASIDKRKMLPLIENSGWNEFLELNRMAFDSYLPKNSESRCIAITIKLIKKNAPHIKWIVSYADSCQCGDGTIYRASGFFLTAIKKNTGMWILRNGNVIADIITRQAWNTKNVEKRTGFRVGESWATFKKRENPKRLEGFQLRYIYLIDKSCKITVPILPFSKIDEMNAGMYKGKKRLQADAHKRGSKNHLEKGGANPTRPLHLKVTYG
jgi:hypothetical protein